MGNSTSKGEPPIIARCSSPAYCVQVVGSRHVLLGGGGGASKTGVPNNIQTLLLSFDSKSLTAEDLPKTSERLPLIAEVTDSLETNPHATMNMDCVLLGAAEQGKYLLAAGHDEFCDLYESNGFSLSKEKKNEQPSLALSFEKISRIISDEKPSNAYQKTVRFDRSVEGQPQRLYTGGADGCIRIWDVEKLRQGSSSKHTPLIKIKAHQGDVDDLDISPNGKLCISVGHDATVYIWNTTNGEKICNVPVPKEIGDGFKVRSVRFTVLGSKNTIFLATYNQIRFTRKAVSHVALWAFNNERNVCRPILVREACRETISALAVSRCGNFFAIGTMDGGVGIYDTHELKLLYFAQKTHGIFVTAIDFLPQKTHDFGPLGGENERQRFHYPGVASEYRAAVISLSADQTVQFHAVPSLKPTLFTYFLYFGKVVGVKGYETPRRALGDLKNVFATPVSTAIKRRIPEKSQSSFDVYCEKGSNKNKKEIIAAPEDSEPVQEGDDTIEKFNFEEHIETYEEMFPKPEQRIDVADLLHSVQTDDRFLRSLFSELLDDDSLKLLNESKLQFIICYHLADI
uniref:WD_REPEATS_REGION domain-containing protein n=1 Tax=Elaeophora elaphi TaxID=1147741 RepID=A0A0R3RKS0_9BILA